MHVSYIYTFVPIKMFVITDCDNKLIMFCEMKHDCLNESAPKPNDSLTNAARAAQDTIAIAWRSRSRSRKIYDARTSPDVMYGRRSTAQQKDERQNNSDKKRLARHHHSDLLRLLTRERIGGGQHGVVSPVLRASPFSNFPCAPREASDAHAYT